MLHNSNNNNNINSNINKRNIIIIRNIIHIVKNKYFTTGTNTTTTASTTPKNQTESKTTSTKLPQPADMSYFTQLNKPLWLCNDHLVWNKQSYRLHIFYLRNIQQQQQHQQQQQQQLKQTKKCWTHFLESFPIVLILNVCSTSLRFRSRSLDNWSFEFHSLSTLIIKICHFVINVQHFYTDEWPIFQRAYPSSIWFFFQSLVLTKWAIRYICNVLYRWSKQIISPKHYTL